MNAVNYDRALGQLVFYRRMAVLAERGTPTYTTYIDKLAAGSAILAIEYLVSLIYEANSMPRLSGERQLELFYRYDSAVKTVTILTGKTVYEVVGDVKAATPGI